MVVGTVAGLLLGTGLYVTSPAVTRATVSVEASRVAAVARMNSQVAPPKLVTADTDVHLVLSDEVVTAVAQAIGVSPSEVRRNLTVRARAVTRVLEISYTDPSVARAERAVQVAGEAFLAMRDRLVLQPVRDYLTEVDIATRRVVTGIPQADRAKIEPEDSDSEVLRRRAQAELAALPPPGLVMEDARLTKIRDRGDVEVPLASGAAAGALVGFGAFALAGLRKRRDPS